MNRITDSQRRAIEADGNVLVVAGAGTGKTRTLVARCLARVCDAAKPVSLDQVLMVTFTEAAAAEMRKRLREGLEKQTEAQPDNPRLAEQLALLDAARISTLHSFCLHLAHEHFHELGLDPQIAVLAEEQARLLARETLERVLQQHYAGDTAIAAAVQQLVLEQGRGWDQPIRHLVERIHHYTQTLRDPAGWFRAHLAAFQRPAPERWEQWLREGVDQWRALWLPILRSQPAENCNAHKCADCLGKLNEGATRDQMATVLAEVLEEVKEWPGGKKGAYRDPLEKFIDDAAFLHSVAFVREGVDPLAQDWDWVRPQMSALLQLAQEFTREFARAKRELAAVDFHDLEQFALELLCDRATGRPTDLARQWREQLELVFVDEYQDINEAQDTILRAVGHEGAGSNRFLVGDVKQSIYRFRLANPEIFQRYAQSWRATKGDARTGDSSLIPPLAPPGRGTNSAASGASSPPTFGSSSPPREGLGVGSDGQVIALADNFRSHESIVVFVNALFSSLMHREIGGVDYDGEQRLRFGAAGDRKHFSLAADASPRVELRLRLTGGAEAEPEEDDQTAHGLADFSNAEKEALGVASRLRELKNRPFEIWDKAGGRFRPVEWSDMAILLRSPRNKAESYARAFEQSGVPLTVARGGFFESLEISDLLNALRLLDNPLQDRPLLAVLRSPLVGMTLNELAAIRLAQRRGCFWTALQRFQRQLETPAGGAAGAEEQTARHKAASFLKSFARWRLLARQAALSQCLETVLDETCYEAWLLAQSRGQQRRDNAQRLLALTRQFDQFQRQGLFLFLKFIEAQLEADIDLEPAPVATEDAVQLMSIHQSKGLEFPVVVVADLGKRFNWDDLRGRVILDEVFGLCPKVKPPHAAQLYPSLPYWLAQRRQQRESLGEELRLLYVALTRACDRLILAGTTSRKTAVEKWSRAPMMEQPAATVQDAGSCLDWLGRWLPRAAGRADWMASGQNSLLAWTIYEDDDARLAVQPARADPPTGAGGTGEALDSTAVQSLRKKLHWHYPFAAATLEPAKTSVSALRRRLREDAEDEAKPLFQTPRVKVRVRPQSPGGASKLTAAQVGTAHHVFLECASLDRVASRTELTAEAERLRQAAVLSADEVAALDFEALLAFWQSELGCRIRAQQPEHIHRELPFTARMSRADLAGVKLPVNAALPEDEFLVVQGVADLAVILPKEIWLVDFKTDNVDRSELPAAVQFYEPQIRLYALALARIYQRRVTGAWLHFFSRKESVAVT